MLTFSNWANLQLLYNRTELFLIPFANTAQLFNDSKTPHGLGLHFVRCKDPQTSQEHLNMDSSFLLVLTFAANWKITPTNPV